MVNTGNLFEVTKKEDFSWSCDECHVVDKTTCISDFVMEKCVDILAVTER